MGNHNLPTCLSKSEKSTKKGNDKYNQGKPVGLNSGLKIKFNKNTGLLQGFPREWAEDYDLNLPIDKTKMVQGSHYDVHIKPSKLPQKIIDMVVSRKVGSVIG